METKGEVFQGKRMGQQGGDTAVGAGKELAPSCRRESHGPVDGGVQRQNVSVESVSAGI